VLENNPIVFPMPTAVLQSISSLLTTFSTYVAIGTTLSRLLLSLMVSMALGVTIGLIAGINRIYEALLQPVVTILRTVPIVTIIVLFWISIGYENAPYAITFLMIFPIVYQSTLSGVKNISSEHLDVIKLDSDVATWQIIKDVYFPMVMPFIKSAFFQSLGLGFKVLVTAEFIVQARGTVGYMIYLEKQNLNFHLVYSWTIIVVGLVLMIEYITKRLQEEVTE
jgi:NitT/TauT family transport system permease protein